MFIKLLDSLEGVRLFKELNIFDKNNVHYTWLSNNANLETETTFFVDKNNIFLYWKNKYIMLSKYVYIVYLL